MSDPTKQAQAATAKTARETIAEAADVIQALIKAPFLAPARVAALESEKALRALLDAPEGGAQRVIEAMRDFADNGLRADLSPTRCVNSVQDALRTEQDYLRRIDAITRERARSALAALRARPESVESVEAGVSEVDAEFSGYRAGKTIGKAQERRRILLAIAELKKKSAPLFFEGTAAARALAEVMNEFESAVKSEAPS